MRASIFATGLVLALSAAALWAQEGGGQGRRGGGQGGFGGGRGFGFGGGGMTIDKVVLIGSEQVRKELKVTEEQGKKIEEILTAHREAQRGLMPGRGNRDASPEERQKAREEATKKTAELSKQTEGKLAAVLEKPQTERLDQILLQQQGADGLVGENVVAALKLSEEQVKKMKGAIATRDEELNKLRGSFGRGGGGGGAGGGNFQEIREKTDKLRKDTDAAVLGFLSKEQSEALAKLKGAAFELDRQSLFRGGFGGGRGGPGGGPGGGDSSKERKRPAEDDSK
jgi:hypothetical protein